ncbi:hypothetical protein GF352_01265 [archaeon]|nr:hypothetical protein [archaeon]
MISVVQCPKCGWLQATKAVRQFKCRRCNHSRGMRRVKVIKVVKNPQVARLLIGELRKKL